MIQARAIFRETGIISVPLPPGRPRATIRRSRFPLCICSSFHPVGIRRPGVSGWPSPCSEFGAGAELRSDDQSLRNLTLSGDGVSVSNVELKREAGTFHLRSGSVCFVGAVNGKVTGAVFTGDGNFSLVPPESERGMLKLLTKEDEFSENFSQMVLRFTDSSYDELKKAGTSGGGCDAGPLKDSQHTMRHKLKDHLDARILEDVLSPSPGELFFAFIHGKRYNDEELFSIDP